MWEFSSMLLVFWVTLQAATSIQQGKINAVTPSCTVTMPTKPIKHQGVQNASNHPNVHLLGNRKPRFAGRISLISFKASTQCRISEILKRMSFFNCMEWPTSTSILLDVSWKVGKVSVEKTPATSSFKCFNAKQGRILFDAPRLRTPNRSPPSLVA